MREPHRYPGNLACCDREVDMAQAYRYFAESSALSGRAS